MRYLKDVTGRNKSFSPEGKVKIKKTLIRPILSPLEMNTLRAIVGKKDNIKYKIET